MADASLKSRLGFGLLFCFGASLLLDNGPFLSVKGLTRIEEIEERMKVFASVFCLLLCLTAWAKSFALVSPLNVVFINPGCLNDIGVWGFVSKFMQEAAHDLSINLEILYADRDHIRMMEQAQSVSLREHQPDAVILVNEKQSANIMMAYFKDSPASILLLHNDLTEDQRKEMGGERQNVPNWIATVITDEYKASLLLMQALARHCPQSLVAAGVSGVKSNPVTLEREAGLVSFFEDPRHGGLVRIVHADWSREGGKERTKLLLDWYPRLNVIWAANDSMALGALDAAKEAGKGMEIAIGGQGGFPAALESIRKGELNATVGGTIMTGAWALVLLYDYFKGVDFAADTGVRVKPDHLVVIDNSAKAEQFERIVIEHPERINFRQFSKASNPGLEHYDFRFERVIESAGEKPIK